MCCNDTVNLKAWHFHVCIRVRHAEIQLKIAHSFCKRFLTVTSAVSIYCNVTKNMEGSNSTTGRERDFQYTGYFAVLDLCPGIIMPPDNLLYDLLYPAWSADAYHAMHATVCMLSNSVGLSR